MSLVGFKATNHPKQTRKRGASDTVDERITPQWLFDELNAVHRFTLDAAANATNAKVNRFYDLTTDGLAQSWSGETVWCNPPYSDIKAWVEKAIAETQAGCPKVVMLLPANRTEQRWWQDYIENNRDDVQTRIKTRFLARRINFGVPGNEGASYKSSSPFGLVIVTISGRGAQPSTSCCSKFGDSSMNAHGKQVTAKAALTPPETAEAVPGDPIAAYLAGVQRGREEIAHLRKELERVTQERDDYLAAASDPAPATDDRERLVEEVSRYKVAMTIAADELERRGVGQDQVEDLRAALATEASR